MACLPALSKTRHRSANGGYLGRSKNVREDGNFGQRMQNPDQNVELIGVCLRQRAGLVIDGDRPALKRAFFFLARVEDFQQSRNVRVIGDFGAHKKSGPNRTSETGVDSDVHTMFLSLNCLLSSSVNTPSPFASADGYRNRPAVPRLY